MSPALEAALAGPPAPLPGGYPRCTDACQRRLSPVEQRLQADRARRSANKGKRRR